MLLLTKTRWNFTKIIIPQTGANERWKMTIALLITKLRRMKVKASNKYISKIDSEYIFSYQYVSQLKTTIRVNFNVAMSCNPKW